MIIDKNNMFADDLAYDGTPTVVDLQAVGAGKGESVKIWVQGSSTLADATGITITDGATSSAADAHITWTCTLAGKILEFTLPSDVARYVTLALAGSPSAGTWSAGITLEGVQSAQ